jgi:SAM-dependent methyltransferase
MALPLDAFDEHNRYSIQLYHRTTTQVDLSGKEVLEVSCGHGGGASYLVRTFRPASYTGLDLNTAGIAFCQTEHNLPGLDFVHGNAEDLPFADQSFDALINIEVSHHSSTPNEPPSTRGKPLSTSSSNDWSTSPPQPEPHPARSMLRRPPPCCRSSRSTRANRDELDNSDSTKHGDGRMMHQ